MRSGDFSFDIVKSSRRLRELRGKTSHAKLAEATGIGAQSLKNYEQAALHEGKYEGQASDRTLAIAGMSVNNLCSLTNYFNVSADYLLGLSDTPTRDIDLDRVCAYTGLTWPSAMRLHDLAKEEDEQNSDIISFLFQFLHNLLVFEDMNSFRGNALLAALSNVVHSKTVYDIETYEKAHPVHIVENEKKRLLGEISGEHPPSGTIEISADIAASLYEGKAKACLMSAFEDALMFLEKSISDEYGVRDFINAQRRKQEEQEKQEK